MKPAKQFKKYLDIISADIFPGKENTVGIIENLEQWTAVNDAFFIYWAPDDLYLFHQFHFNEIFSNIKPSASFHPLNTVNLAVVNSEVDLRDNKREILLPRMTTKMYLACGAAHEVRHRMQMQLNYGKPLIMKDQYVKFQCFWDVALSIQEQFDAREILYNPELSLIEFDAWMIQRIFFVMLWLNHTQRGINFNESIKISAKVLTMSAEELREQMNQFCYLG
jgi:hypothetical protein